MTATAKQIAALAAPTPAEEIGTKPGKGGSGGLSYIDARFVFDRFDEAVGPENWQCDIVWSPTINLEDNISKGGKVIEEGTMTTYPLARLGVLIGHADDGAWVWKSDIGDYSDISSVKGGVSDSIKRAAVLWGVARDLYPKPSDKKKGTNSRREGQPEAEEKPRRKRSTKKAVSAEVEQQADAEQDVVGQSGLTDKQKAKMFATLREAGVPDDKRKELVHTICGQWSTKDMSNDDLDLVLAFSEGGEYKAE